MIEPGRLQHRIQVHRPAGVDPVEGTRGTTPTLVWQGWAEILDVLASSRAAVVGHTVLAEASARLTTHHTTAIRQGDHITVLARGRVLVVIAPPAEIGHREGLEILAKDWGASA